jgi:hypothetical protein
VAEIQQSNNRVQHTKTPKANNQTTACNTPTKKYSAFFETCKDFFAALDFAQSSFRTYP